MKQSLEDRILNRLPAGVIVGIATLDVGVSYDSNGRALRILIAKGRIVRVARGRYKRATGKRAVSLNSIGDIISRRVRGSSRNVFLRSDFSKLGSYDAVGRALRKLTREGRLVQIGYGLYAKAAISPFSGKPAPIVGIKRLAGEALRRIGKTVVPSEFEKAYNTGRSTQVPTGRTIAVKNRMRRRIGYDGNYVFFERA